MKFWQNIKKKTRMHSSRMCTVRSSSHLPVGGGCLPVGVGGVCPVGVCQTPPCEQNDWQTLMKILPCYVADGKKKRLKTYEIKIKNIVVRGGVARQYIPKYTDIASRSISPMCSTSSLVCLPIPCACSCFFTLEATKYFRIHHGTVGPKISGNVSLS